MLEWFQDVFGWLPDELFVALVSMIPVIEVRGALPLAYLLDMSFWIAFPICVMANMIPVVLILKYITPVFAWLKKSKWFRPIVVWLEKRAERKGKQVQSEEEAELQQKKTARGLFWGLALFVGIPLPGTGAWNGALIAALVNMPFKKAFWAILLGVVIASVLMSLAMWGLLDPILSLFA